jgi:hypothetical protein
MLVSSINPLHLRGLNQALYILHCLGEGHSNEQIVQKFDGDKQLVDMWMSFVKHNHWIEKDRLGQWQLTEKGREWARKLPQESDPSNNIQQ